MKIDLKFKSPQCSKFKSSSSNFIQMKAVLTFRKTILSKFHMHTNSIQTRTARPRRIVQNNDFQVLTFTNTNSNKY